MSKPIDNYFEAGLEALDAADYAAAVEIFSKALRLSLGDLGEVLRYRGIAYAYLGDNERALADFNAALQQNPYDADAYNERGNLLRLSGELRAAVSDYNSALRIDPEYAEAYYNRALAFEALGLLPEAEDDLSAAIQRNPGIAPAYEVRGRVRAAQQRYSDAIHDLQRYLRMGGGRQYDNHAETQSFILVLRLRRFFQFFRIFRPGR